MACHTTFSKDEVQRHSVQPLGTSETRRVLAITRKYLSGETLKNPKAGKIPHLVEEAFPDLLPQTPTRCRPPLARHGRRKVPAGSATPGSEFSTWRPLLRTGGRGEGPPGLMGSTLGCGQDSLPPGTKNPRVRPGPITASGLGSGHLPKFRPALPREARTLPRPGTW